MAKSKTTTNKSTLNKTRMGFKEVIAYNDLSTEDKFTKIIDDKEVVIGSYKYDLSDEMLDWIYDKYMKINGEKIGFETQGMIGFSTSKLIQNTSKDQGIDDKGEEGSAGMLLLDGRASKTLTAVPIFNYRSRSKFEDGATSPSCGSPNGVFSFSGTICASCPDKDWIDGEKAKCSESEVIMFYDVETDKVFSHYFRGSSRKVGTELIKKLRANSSIFERQVELSSIKVSGKLGNWRVMAYDIKDAIDDEAMLKCYMLSFLMKNWRSKKLDVAKSTASNRLFQKTGENLHDKIDELEAFTGKKRGPKLITGKSTTKEENDASVDNLVVDVIAEDDSDNSSVFDIE